MNSPSPDSVPPSPPKPTAEKWFAQEVQPHDGQLKAWLRKSFPAVRDVDDVAQESYIRIWKARALHPIDSAKAFLFKVARHVALDVLRKNRNANLDSEGDATLSRVLDDGPTAVHAALTQDLLHHLADAIAAVPARDREVLILHKLHGLTQREVAERLHTPERTVEKRCLRALRACERFLRRRGIDRFYD